MIERNLLTVDVEDWTTGSLFLLSKREAMIARGYLPVQDPQVDRGVRCLIDLLEETNFKATFFVLGETAKSHKELIRLIHDRGHEVASHSMTHTLLPRLSVAQLAYELRESKKLLEDLLGAPVLGFRAPNLCIYPDLLSFFHQLQAAGYSYDSSLTATAAKIKLKQPQATFPIIGLEPNIVEIPVTMRRFIIREIPLGGTYLVLLGPLMASTQIRKENSLKGKPAIIYVHPYEIDGFPLRWVHPSPSLKARFSLMLRNTRKGHHIRLLTYLLKNHRFTSIREYLGVITPRGLSLGTGKLANPKLSKKHRSG